jgi:hypothetical protein
MMTTHEANVTAYEILVQLDRHSDIKERLLEKTDLSDKGFKDMMTVLLEEIHVSLNAMEDRGE